MVMDSKQTFEGYHILVYTNVELQCFIPETYVIIIKEKRNIIELHYQNVLYEQ